MANIIVVGEVLFDRISEKGGANSYEMFLGGAPANCAMGISFFEKHTVFFVGGVGTDDFGRRALHTLKNNGVRTEYVTRTDYPTRIVTVKRDPIGNNRVFGGFQEGNKEIYADEDIHPIILQHAFFEREYTLLYTGSLIMAGRKSLDAVREMLALAQEKNIPIFLDVNMRPVFFSEDTSAMIIAIETFLSVASIVKMSEDELALLTREFFEITDKITLENTKHLQRLAQMYLERFSSLTTIFFTFGGYGSYAFQKNGEEYVCILEGRDAVDETGAGDAYCAGVIDEIASQVQYGKTLGKLSLSAIVQQGSDLGARVASCRGALCYKDKERHNT